MQGRGDITSFSLTRFTRKLVLFSYGYFLLFLFRDDMIKHYIHERYQPLTVAASIILITASMAYPSTVGNKHHCDAASAGKSSPLKSVLFAMLAVFIIAPVAWGFIAPPEVLGAASGFMGRRFSFTSHQSSMDPEAIRKPDPRDKTLEFPTPDGNGVERRSYAPINIMELNYFLSGDSATYDGDRVAVQGFVYHEEDNHEGEFTLVRYQVPCCIVHAHPVTIVVAGPEADSLPTEQWVVIYGTIRKMDEAHSRLHSEEAREQERRHKSGTDTGKDDHDREKVILPYFIEAEKIERKNTPQDPYINRWFMKKPFQF